MGLRNTQYTGGALAVVVATTIAAAAVATAITDQVELVAVTIHFYSCHLPTHLLYPLSEIRPRRYTPISHTRISIATEGNTGISETPFWTGLHFGEAATCAHLPPATLFFPLLDTSRRSFELEANRHEW
jgi:hypothetical protein